MNVNNKLNYYNFTFGNTQNKSSAYDDLKEMKVSALRRINGTTYSGETLELKDVCDFKRLKDSGIDTIIDLREKESLMYAKKCQTAGISYHKFPLDFIFNPGKSDIFIGEKRSGVNNNFINGLKQFLNITKNGKVYMGCQYGLDRTNFAIILNYLFNFQSKDEVPNILSSDIGRSRTLLNKDLDLIRKILKKMDAKQFEILELPKNFNEILARRIRELITRNR